MSPIATTLAAQPMPEVLAQMLMLIGVVAIGMLLTISIRRKITKKNAATPAPRERIAMAKIPRRLNENRQAAASDLHDTARRLAASLDVKAERLDQLIMEAGRRIAELQALVDSPGSSGRSAAPVDDETEPITRESERHLPPDPKTSPTPRPVTIPELSKTLDPLTRSVYELSDAGHDPVSIAQTLDEQIGKVELVLALREH